MGINKSLVGLAGLSLAFCFATGCGDSDEDKDKTVDPGSGTNTETCKDNDYKCDGNKLMICKSNKWDIKQTCDSSTETCNKSKHTCEKKTTTPQPQTEEECVNDTFKCEGKKAYKCESKEWHLLRTCDISETCVRGTGECRAPQCQVGSAKCDGNTLVVCSSAAQEKREQCESPSVCNASTGECMENTEVEKIRCTLSVGTTKVDNGDSICYGSNLITCDGGDIEEEECPENHVCNPGEPKCSRLKICHVGGKILKTGDYACDDNKDVVRCMDGELKVINDCGADGNTSEVCIVDDETYGCGRPSGSSCSSGNTTVESGKRICEGNVLKLCRNGELSEGKDCRDNTDGMTVCMDGRCVESLCENGLKEGAKICNEEHTQIRICTQGQLVDATGADACKEDQVCQPGDPVKCVSKSQIKDYTTIPSIHADYDAITGVNPAGCMGDGKEYMTDANVKITNGVITAIKSNGVFIQDPTVESGVHAGILVNCTNSNCDKVGFTDDKWAEGDNVTVTARYLGYKDCQMWITTKGTDKIKVTKTNGDKKIGTYTVAVDKINSGQHNDYNGTLVTLENVKVSECKDTEKYCGLKDTNNKMVSATNYIRASTVNSLKKNVDKSLDIVGIVYYHSTLKTSTIAPTLIEVREETSSQE